MKILAIESSCDETAAAVVEDGRRVLSSVVASQVEEHKIYGGVVPEIASRRHTEAISGVVQQALDDAGLSLGGIDAIAVTAAQMCIRDRAGAPGIFAPARYPARKRKNTGRGTPGRNGSPTTHARPPPCRPRTSPASRPCGRPPPR